MGDWLLAALAPLGMLWALEAVSRADAAAVWRWLRQAPELCLLNYALFLGLCLVLAAIPSRRIRASVLTAAGFLCAALGVVNRYKMFYRMEPLLFTDVLLMGDAAQAVAGLSLDIDRGQIVCVVVFFAALLALCIARVRGRSHSGVLLPLMGAALLCALPPVCTFALEGGVTRYDMVDHARNGGTLYTALATENLRREQMRVDYDEQDVRARYRALMDAAPESGAQEQPNVIVVLSESFADDAWLSQYVQLTRSLTPFYDSLVQGCRHGRMYVPRLGGGTSETEFEVLTGMRSRYTVNPYSLGLPATHSMASVLRSRGYSASAIHWYYGVYYNRYHNLRMLGFERFDTIDTTTKPFAKKGMFISDDAHYDAILERLGETQARDFVFCLTMQNHGGYDYDDFSVTYGADAPFTNALSPQTHTVLSNYCWLLEESDRALERFITALEQWEEPTVVVFFSDHIPPLGAAAYAELGVSMTDDAGHLTPYFIWSNCENTLEAQNLYAWQLGAYALEAAGVTDDPFFSYINDLRRDMQSPAAESLTAAAQADETQSLLSYDALFGAQYAYDEGGLAPEAELQAGGRMMLSGFDAAMVGDRVYVSPRLETPHQVWKLEVNGRLRDVPCLYPSDFPATLRCVMANSSGKRLNESNALTYQAPVDLLDGGALGHSTVPLWDVPYETVKSPWYARYTLYRSTRPVRSAQTTALCVDGDTALQWQPTYGLNRMGQYSVDAEGYVWITLPRRETEAAGGAQAYLRAHEAQLWCFGE